MLPSSEIATLPPNTGDGPVPGGGTIASSEYVFPVRPNT